MFNNNPMSSKQEQVSEQVFEPIYVPVIVGNEAYVIIQQDVRNVTDRRFVSCIKCPNGLRDLQDLFGAKPQNTGQEQQVQNVPQNIQNLPQSIFDLINSAATVIQNQCQQNQMNATAQAKSPPPPPVTVAPLQTQLDWEMRECLAERPNQFTYGKLTSTTDLRDFSRPPDCCKQQPYCIRPILKVLISKGTNTTAEEIVDELETQKKEAMESSNPTAQEKRKNKKKSENN